MAPGVTVFLLSFFSREHDDRHNSPPPVQRQTGPGPYSRPPLVSQDMKIVPHGGFHAPSLTTHAGELLLGRGVFPLPSFLFIGPVFARQIFAPASAPVEER